MLPRPCRPAKAQATLFWRGHAPRQALQASSKRDVPPDLEAQLAGSVDEDLPAAAAKQLLQRTCVAAGELVTRRAAAEQGYDTHAHPDPQGSMSAAQGLARRNDDIASQLHALMCSDTSFRTRHDGLGGLHRDISHYKGVSDVDSKAAMRSRGRGSGAPGCDKRSVERETARVEQQLVDGGVRGSVAPFAAEVEVVGTLDEFLLSFNAAFVRVRPRNPLQARSLRDPAQWHVLSAL